ncbi:MAG TPA: LysM peptidoglycan-binding domain-containing protein [Opitutaceae bacterium]|nr:LysM peptidoglycan-binding domain-containing protein [Opitutaceae bacterium]
MIRSFAILLLVFSGLMLSGCGYVHFGRHVPLQVQTELDAENSSLRRQLAAARASTAEPPPYETLAGASDDVSAGVRLATALRSYQLLQEENDQLRQLAASLTAERDLLKSQLAGATTNAAALSEQLTASEATARLVETLRTQLRQTQDQLQAIIAEHSQLRTRMAVASPPPGSVTVVPARPVPAAPPPAAPVDLRTPERVIHTVAEGETLSGIARQYYRDGQRWPEIFAANRTLLADERSLRIGMQLQIP